MSETKVHVLSAVQDKETKSTYRYQIRGEDEESGASISGSIYIGKDAFSENVPKKLDLRIKY